MKYSYYLLCHYFIVLLTIYKTSFSSTDHNRSGFFFVDASNVSLIAKNDDDNNGSSTSTSSSSSSSINKSNRVHSHQEKRKSNVKEEEEGRDDYDDNNSINIHCTNSSSIADNNETTASVTMMHEKTPSSVSSHYYYNHHPNPDRRVKSKSINLSIPHLSSSSSSSSSASSSYLVEKWHNILNHQKQKEEKKIIIDDIYYYTKFERQLLGLQYVQPDEQSKYYHDDYESKNTSPNNTSSQSSSSSSHSPARNQEQRPKPKHPHDQQEEKPSLFKSISYSILIPVISIFTMSSVSCLYTSISTTSYIAQMNIFNLLMDWKNIPIILLNLSLGDSILRWNSNNKNEKDQRNDNYDITKMKTRTNKYTSMQTPSSSTATTIMILQVMTTVTKPIIRYISNKIIPQSISTFKRFALMEFWRLSWMHLFKNLRNIYKFIFNSKYHDSTWEIYAPGWLKRGMKTLFIKYTKRYLELSFGDVYSKGFDLIGMNILLDNTSDDILDDDDNGGDLLISDGEGNDGSDIVGDSMSSNDGNDDYNNDETGGDINADMDIFDLDDNFGDDI
mmetsp:Transcript_26063/g.29788  ORF Transcript_26063/g.29788 Transcript_26063/m.29788 type:complete len:559 (-) Transcript_26063:1861-3537(-)